MAKPIKGAEKSAGKTTFTDAIQKAREAGAAAITVVVDSAAWKWGAAVVSVVRDGLLALEKAAGKFAAAEPEISEACGAPTKTEYQNNPECYKSNPYTDSEHEGYKPLRELLKKSDPAVSMAEDLIASLEKSGAAALDGNADYIAASNIVNGWSRRQGQAISYLHRAWLTRIGVVRSPTEPETTQTMVKDFAEELRKRANGKQKGVPEAEVKAARFWYNLLAWALEGSNRKAAEDIAYRYGLGLATARPAPEVQPPRTFTPAEVAAVNAAIDQVSAAKQD